MKKTIPLILAALTTLIFFVSCSKEKDSQVTLITKTDSIRVNFSNSKAYTFFSFKNDAVVANSDSASSNWDFGLRLTTFILNSHTYGPGDAGAILQPEIYDNVKLAPDAGFAYDTSSSQKAIKDGSWYNYNPATHAFNPRSGQTFIFKTALGFYAKMELLAVDYEPFTGPSPQVLIYRFRFTYQASGNKNL
jgi:hypothetical protein